MKWMYDGHREAMLQAVHDTPAINRKGVLSREYAAALYLLTGLEYVWPRVKQFADRDGIDHEAMLGLRLSRGECLIVGLSWNLFNGGTGVRFTPIDLIDHLDSSMLELAAEGFEIRRGSLTLAMLERKPADTRTVVEWCPHCENEIEMRWSTDADGFKAFCPVCGNRLMLCDECHHRNDGTFNDDCDYDRETDTCRFNPAKQDMSGTCGFAYLTLFGKRERGEITEEEFLAYYTEHCGKCRYMNEVCMYEA